MPQKSTATKSQVRKRTDIIEFKKYNVVMLNDDITTMEFVVNVLINVFFKTQDIAESLMMKIHTEGSAVVGTYDFDTAKSKIEKVRSLASKEGFPLRLTIKQA
jgi:ATP-dependent Clp protease adaptor protein ClpS